MDDLVNTIANALGVHPATLVLLLTIVVAVANLIGKNIPDDATGVFGVVRKICKVIGLYTPTKITDGVTVNDTARVVAGLQSKSSLTSQDSKANSPAVVGLLAILLGITTMFLGGCTTAQTQRAETTVNVLCTSLPLAQIAYATAVQHHDNATVNAILSTLQVSCPTVLTALHAYEETQQPIAVPASPPPLPPETPERG